MLAAKAASWAKPAPHGRTVYYRPHNTMYIPQLLPLNSHTSHAKPFCNDTRQYGACRHFGPNPQGIFPAPLTGIYGSSLRLHDAGCCSQHPQRHAQRTHHHVRTPATAPQQPQQSRKKTDACQSDGHSDIVGTATSLFPETAHYH